MQEFEQAPTVVRNSGRIAYSLLSIILFFSAYNSHLKADIISLDGTPVNFNLPSSGNVLRVSDNGVGIKKDATEALFL